MSKICLYFQIHQPWRLRSLSPFELGTEAGYFESDADDDEGNEKVMGKVAEKSYRPMLLLLRRLSQEEPDFHYSLSITGVAIEQMSRFAPDLILLLQDLCQKGNVEFLAETYYHSLASLFSTTEFLIQVQKHSNQIEDLFSQRPKVFRNTELIYTNRVAEIVEKMNFTGMLVEGADKVLRGRKPTFVYRSPSGLPLLLKHYALSDDIAFRFSQSARSPEPLVSETFCHWINSSYSENETVNLFMDFETFGEHQWKDTGIFDFFYHFVKHFLRSGGKFITVSKELELQKPVDIYDSELPVSWADVDRDITAWSGNPLQVDSLKKIYEMEKAVFDSGNENLVEDWRKLQTSDHFYYMCTKWSNDGDVHSYFSPYKNPYRAYVNFCHALADLNIRFNNYKNG